MGSQQSKIRESSRAEIEEDWPWVWGIRDPECLDWKIGLSDEDVRNQALNQRNLPVSISDQLYLGNAPSVESVAKLKECGITAVLNMAGPLALHRKTIREYKANSIKYKQINAKDEYEYPLLKRHWKDASDFIRVTTAGGKGKVVVHCMAGMNRSALIVTAYHMISTQTPVLEAVRHVRKQRGNVALMNEGFQEQLVAMARDHKLLGAAPGTPESIIMQTPPRHLMMESQ